MTIQRTTVTIALSMSFLASSANGQDTPASQPQLPTASAKLSYALGLEIGGWLKQLGEDINVDAFTQAVTHTLHNEKQWLSSQQAFEIKRTAFARIQQRQKEQAKLAGQKNLDAGAAFLAANKEKEAVITTDSGLQYTVLRQGDGEKPTATSKVTVHYRGTLLNDTEFDSSYQRGEPVTFPLNGVIPGWTEGLQLMNTGGHYRFFIPSHLAYGERGSEPKIGPNATLVFEVELLKIEQ